MLVCVCVCVQHVYMRDIKIQGDLNLYIYACVMLNGGYRHAQLESSHQMKLLRDIYIYI